MTSTEIATTNGANGAAYDGGTAAALEQVVMHGDLKALTAQQRVAYYRRVCESVGLNPLSRPFDYILLNNKLTLYARKDATDQLRRVNGVSITRLDREQDGDLYVVTAYAVDKHGRQDVDMGAVAVKGLSGEALVNARLKAVTKSKRRVTLSLCGLGWLDETEVSSIPDARPVTVTEAGEIVSPAEPSSPSYQRDTAIQHVPHEAQQVPPDEEAQEAARSYTGPKRTAGTVEQAQRAAGIITHKEWMAAQELDPNDKALSRYLLGWSLGREIASRGELTGADWGKANHELKNLASEDVARLVGIHMDARAASIQAEAQMVGA